MKQVIIDCDDHSIDYTVEEVLRLIKEGYTSGIDPTWEIIGKDDEEGGDKHE